jgi:hypothetical protein
MDFSFFLRGARLNPLGMSATTGLLYQPRKMDDDDCGAVSGISDRGNRSTRRKPIPALLCPQIPHDLGSNPGRDVGKRATNRLRYGAAVEAGLHNCKI